MVNDTLVWLFVICTLFVGASNLALQLSHKRVVDSYREYNALLSRQRQEWEDECFRVTKQLVRLQRYTEIRMGNWRSVMLEGTCAKGEVDALREAVRMQEDYSNFHCLTNTGGIGGLNNWPAEVIKAVGNLAERDYSVAAVAQQLEELAKVAPSLTLWVHCGGDYEDKECVASVRLMFGVATIEEPQLALVPEMSDEQIRANIMAALRK